ncbi:MAG: trypsin-like peptidase domain-containing protein [Patescibacteria group bacterium]
MKKILIPLALIVIIIAALSHIKGTPFSNINTQTATPLFGKPPTENQKVVYEESVITDVVEKSLPSVVTIGIVTSGKSTNSDPFNPFNPFAPSDRSSQDEESNIGSGFIVSRDGLVITNKHVVSDTNYSYKVLTNDNKKYDVQKIYRDPLNDLAILKIDATNLTPLPFGDSSKLKLGQMAIAIGTPLGEFTNTVTAGIISGLGRGITAGSPFEGAVEKLDNVIQTDAAISPGNSGGPLLNSTGQIIGINTAVAAEGQNIGFAIPANVIRELLQKFESNGMSFERPFIGVRYKMIDRQTALLNDVVEGAYVIDIIADSPADKADLQVEDIIMEIDGKKVSGEDDQAITREILNKKVGDSVRLKLWRAGSIKETSVKLESSQT